MMGTPVRPAFIYLMHLAWKSRLHIPFLLTVCFLVFDIRLQLEVNINMTRRRVNQRPGIEPNADANNRGLINVDDDEDDLDDDESEEDDDDIDEDDSEDDDEDDDDDSDDYYDQLKIVHLCGDCMERRVS